ncbi:cupin domain-containing protein [Streptomyces sp. NPDC088196]|uniref:cupin domain-containing protein n=1 Tax=Streptomyces sp. NPDC088196 TaxID=3154868 RepID=UPI00344FD37F
MAVRPGEVYYNPRCREKIVIRTPAAQTGGERAVMDLYVEPGGFAAGYHTHPFSQEIFTLVRGSLRVHVGGRDIILNEVGQTVTVPAGTVHRWFGNTEKETSFAVVELVNRAERFEQLILRQLFGLAQDGKTDAEGRPNLLQHAVTMREFSDVLRFTDRPWPVQCVMNAALTPLARLLGYRACNPEYLERGPLEVAELEELPELVAGKLAPVARDRGATPGA